MSPAGQIGTDGTIACVVSAADLASPCTGLCTIDPDSGWCLGCARTLDEIAGWGGSTPDDKRILLASLPGRHAVLEAGA